MIVDATKDTMCSLVAVYVVRVFEQFIIFNGETKKVTFTTRNTYRKEEILTTNFTYSLYNKWSSNVLKA